MKILNILLACALAVFIPVTAAIAKEITAPDTTQPGPYQVASGEYHFPASVDPDVLAGIPTEMWAKVFYPKNYDAAAGKAPLVVLLHGNHGTCGTGSHPRKDYSCEYTNTGTCPAGSVPTPNHEGYNYLAENLASWGFWVVSVNANRGITCGGGVEGDYGLNLARGKLVLKHLSLIHQWATTGGAPTTIGITPDAMVGKIDFASVGLLGHSRGGEGVRAAYNLYLDQGSPWPAKIPGLSIKAIFEIGAVDGQTSRVLDANGTNWNQLLPMCDGDVSDLEGRFPFERMLLNASEVPNAQKSLYEVWGANHNFFNTEWQGSDSSGCISGKAIFDVDGIESDKQQKIALASVPAFFRSHLGSKADPALNQNFNPLVTLPNVVTSTTEVDRDFTPSPAASEYHLVDNFDKEVGVNTSGNANLAAQIDITHTVPGYGSQQHAAEISWNAASPNTYFESVWAAKGLGQDVHDFATLDFRVGRQNNKLNSESTTDFGVQLEDANGHFSKEISVSEYVHLDGPGTDNPVVKGVRIPLSVFQGFDLTKVHGVRFIFDKTATGALYLESIRFQRQIGLGNNPMQMRALATMSRLSNAAETRVNIPIVYVPQNLNTIRSIRILQTSAALAKNGAGTEIRVASQVPFTVMDRLPILKIGKQEFKLSRYSDPVNLKELTFTLSAAQYRQLQKSGEVTVTNGKVWKFGSLATWMSSHAVQ